LGGGKGTLLGRRVHFVVLPLGAKNHAAGLYGTESNMTVSEKIAVEYFK